MGTTVTKRWLFLGDGFLDTPADLSAFHNACDAVKGLVEKSPWYKRQKLLGIWRFDTPVTPSMPLIQHAPCAEHPAPIPPMPRTRFQVTFGDEQGPCRQMGGDDEDVLAERDQIATLLGGAYQGFDRVLVLVNTTLYGAMGKTDVAWCSLHNSKSERFPRTALHELGHTFSLLDEYESPCGELDEYSAWQLKDHNIGSEASDVPWKNWGATATTEVEKANDTTCHVYEPGLKPKVAAWEGGNRLHRGFFRPSKKCRMRDSKAEFCDVCTEIIVYSLDPFTNAPPIE